MVIYKATNLINGKVYIGQTINTLEYRKDQHFRETRSKKKKNTYFHNALAKYGFNSFTFEEIDFAESEEELNQKEVYWIKYYQSTNKERGYNLDSGGKNCRKSEETKRKIGQTTIEKWNNPEIAKKMREGLLRGAETMKQKAKRYPFTCPICGNTYYYPEKQAKERKSCSRECARIAACDKKHEVSECAKETYKRIREDNTKRKHEVIPLVEKWVKNHNEIVINCPYNKISTTLDELFCIIFDYYGVKDFRSIFVCFDVKSRKELLDKLKEMAYISKENVC